MTNDEVGATLDTLVDQALGSSPEKPTPVEEKPKVDQPTETKTEEKETPKETTPEVKEQAEDSGKTAKEEARVPLHRFEELYGTLKSKEKEVENLSSGNSKLEQELKSLREEFTKISDQNLTPEQKEIKAAEKTLQELGFVKKADLEAEQAKREAQQAKRAEADKQIEVELTQMEDKYNGKDGLPKFNRQDMVDYMVSTNKTNLTFEEAYQLRYANMITDAKIKAAMERNKSTFTEASDGSGSGLTDMNALKKEIAKGNKKAKSEFLEGLLS